MPSKKKLKAYIKKLAMPPKAQRQDSTGGSASPGAMSAECEWQGDGWRRSGGPWTPPWGEQGSSSTPPPIPAPPPDGQNNLTRKPSIQKEAQRKENATPWRKGQSRGDNQGNHQQQPRHKSTLTWTPSTPQGPEQRQPPVQCSQSSQGKDKRKKEEEEEGMKEMQQRKQNKTLNDEQPRQQEKSDPRPKREKHLTLIIPERNDNDGSKAIQEKNNKSTSKDIKETKDKEEGETKTKDQVTLRTNKFAENEEKERKKSLKDLRNKWESKIQDENEQKEKRRSLIIKQQEKQQEKQEKAKNEQEMQEKAKIEQEKLAKAKIEKEKQEKVKNEREMQEQIKKEKEKQEKAKLEQEKLEKDKLEKEKQERARIEKEKKDKVEKERQDKSRIQRENQEKARIEKERQEKAKIEREKQEKAKFEKEKLEKAKIEKEKQEKAKREKEKLEKAKIEKEKQEKTKLEKEKLEKAKIEKEKQEKAKREKEKLEKAKIEKEKQEKAKIEQEKQNQIKIEQEKQNKIRMRNEQLKADRATNGQAQQEKSKNLQANQDRAKNEKENKERKVSEQKEAGKSDDKVGHNEKSQRKESKPETGRVTFADLKPVKKSTEGKEQKQNEPQNELLRVLTRQAEKLNQNLENEELSEMDDARQRYLRNKQAEEANRDDKLKRGETNENKRWAKPSMSEKQIPERQRPSKQEPNSRYTNKTSNAANTKDNLAKMPPTPIKGGRLIGKQAQEEEEEEEEEEDEDEEEEEDEDEEEEEEDDDEEEEDEEDDEDEEEEDEDEDSITEQLPAPKTVQANSQPETSQPQNFPCTEDINTNAPVPPEDSLANTSFGSEKKLQAPPRKSSKLQTLLTSNFPEFEEMKEERPKEPVESSEERLRESELPPEMSECQDSAEKLDERESAATLGQTTADQTDQVQESTKTDEASPPKSQFVQQLFEAGFSDSKDASEEAFASSLDQVSSHSPHLLEGHIDEKVDSNADEVQLKPKETPSHSSQTPEEPYVTYEHEPLQEMKTFDVLQEPKTLGMYEHDNSKSEFQFNTNPYDDDSYNMLLITGGNPDDVLKTNTTENIFGSRIDKQSDAGLEGGEEDNNEDDEKGEWWERDDIKPPNLLQEEDPDDMLWWDQPTGDEEYIPKAERWWDMPTQEFSKKDKRGDTAVWWKQIDTRAEPCKPNISKAKSTPFFMWEENATLPPDAPPPPKLPRIPKPPPMPGVPPPPPPMPGANRKPLSEARIRQIEQIKKAARTRPDWNTVLKDIEGGVRLKHLTPFEKNDRSIPILPVSRGKGGKFVYESEKPNVRHDFLREIHRGVRLRKARTDDRSKPDFKALGLRKLRRQVTNEEVTNIPSSSDEEEDIDTMRDDLQATKSQLDEEIKTRKKIERESKILKIDIEGLQAEVKKLKRKLREAGMEDPKPMKNGEVDEIVPKLEKSMSKLRMREEEEKLDFSELDVLDTEISNLKSQIDAHKKVAHDNMVKVDEVTQKLLVSENASDEWEMRSNYFEKKYKALQKERQVELPEIDTQGTQTDPADLLIEPPPPSPVEDLDNDGGGDLRKTFPMPSKSGSRRSFASSFNRMESFKEEEEEEDEEESEESEEEEEDEEYDDEEDDEDMDEETAAAKKKERDLKLWKTKLDHMKDKATNIRNDRENLRENIKEYFRNMKLERLEYLKKKKEVDEMIKTLKDGDADDEEEEEEEDEEEEEEEEEEELPAENEDGGGEWWCDGPVQKPKKLKKRKKKKTVDQESEDDDEEEDLEDLSVLAEPDWSDSEREESETDNEEEEHESRISKLKQRTEKHELATSAMKKDNYLLKAQIERCDEMLAAESRRHKRLDEELHIMLTDFA